MVKKADLRQKALKERNIDSMLEDAKNDNKDTDAEHLQRRCELTQLLFNKSNSLTATGAALMPTLISISYFSLLCAEMQTRVEYFILPGY